MTITVRQQSLYARQETTFGTYLEPAGTDILQISNLKVDLAANLRWVTREIIRGSLNVEQGLNAGSLLGFEFDMELKGSGAAGTAPRFGRLMRACAMTETVVPATSVAYKPTSNVAAHEGVSIAYYYGGVKRSAKGCRGAVSLTLGAGMPGKLSFKMLGHINSEVDAAAPSPTFESTRPPNFLNAAFTIGGFAAAIAELSLDPANTVVASTDPNTSDGYGDVRVVSRETVGKANPEAKTIAVKDYVGLFRANTLQAIATGTIGGTAGNRWALSIPNAFLKTPAMGERDQLLTHELEFGAAESASLDDEFTLTLT